MADSEAVVWACLAVLNFAVAALLARAQPRRPANAVAVLLFAANGLLGLAPGLLALGVPAVLLERATWFLASWTVAALLVFPFLFPHRRLPKWGEVVLFAVAGGIVGATAIALLAFPDSWRRLFLGGGPFLGYTDGPLMIASAVGALLFLDTYLASPSEAQREQARFLLATYALKASATAAAVWPGFGGVLPPALPFAAEALRVGLLAATVAAVAVPVALASSRLRRRTARPASHDAFVLGFLGLGVVFPLLGPGDSLVVALEYMLVRPVLFAYGILRYQLLEVDLRRQGALVAAAIVAGLSGLFVSVAATLESWGLSPGVAAGLALGTSLATGAAFARPLLGFVLSGPRETTGARGRELYTAALAEAVAADADHASSEERILRALRSRLGISEREHGLLETAVRAQFGQGSTVGVGQEFLGRYRVLALLGEGGFGRTFLAEDQQVRRRVVLKVARGSTAEEAARTLREARVVARLAHPRIVTVYDVEQVGDQCILVLEHVAGGSLADRLRTGRVPPTDALRIAEDVLEALEAAHAEGVVHRDVKPANILLARDGRAKLADFGVARSLDASGTASGISLEGANPGSLRYMAPEQVRGLPAEPRSDLYAVGVVLYEMLAGRPYLDFTGRVEFDMRLAILQEEPALPLAGLPRPVNQLLEEALAKEPARRPESAASMRWRLAEAQRSLRGPGVRRSASG